MANKKLTNTIEKKGKSAAKRGAKKAVRSTAKNIKKEWAASGEPQKRSAPRRKTLYKILPYLFLLLSLVLAICFVIVRLAGLEDGAGALGYWIQWAMGGLLGGGAPLLALVLGYIGVMWCVHNVKWKENSFVSTSPNFAEYRRAKRRLMLRSIMSMMVVLLVSMIFGVLADYGDLDVAAMWQDGAEELFEGGGIIGSALGCLMVMAFETVISMVILIALLLVFALLAVGLTPDYFLSKIEAARERRQEEKAYLAEQRQIEEAEAREAEKQRRAEERRAAMAAAALAKEAKRAEKETAAHSMSADDIADLTEETPECAEEPAKEIYIGPVRDENTDPVTEMLNAKRREAEEPQDFGGEPGFDTNEYDSMEDMLQHLGNAPSAEQAREEIPVVPLDLSEIGSDELLSDVAEVAPEEGDAEEEEAEIITPYVFPPMDLLTPNKNKDEKDHTSELQENARQLLSTLQSFKINIKEINYSRGPTITRYELKPEAGVRVRSIANLVDDIALSLATSGVRIEAPIPGKPAVGIEVPNRDRATVYLRELIDNPQFTDAKSKLTASLGMDVGGNPIYFDITKMPHMIIAGATGMGKSVCINCIIMSILYKAKPEDVKLILIDPKKVEFALYRDIPHLYAPIVSEPKKAAGALASAVAEMERRFEMIEEVGVRDIASYNAATENDPYKEHMPHMVIIIDELADLMMTAPDEVESSICRLAQKARAAGIHIIIGTQRPSVDVITGLIKANIPSRIACTVASQVDSRTIIDIAGAEKLIGRGDMLFAPVGAAKPLRVQGAFVTEGEVESIVTFIKENNAKAKYNAEFVNRIEEEAAKCGTKKGSGGGGAEALPDAEGGDSKFHDAVKLAVEEGKISTSLMQRRLGVGYGRAAKIIDTMEQMGYVSKPDGNKPRRVLLTAEEYSRRVMEGTLGDSEE